MILIYKKGRYTCKDSYNSAEYFCDYNDNTTFADVHGLG